MMANIYKKLWWILPRALFLGAIFCGAFFLSPAKASAAAPLIQFYVYVYNPSNDPTLSSHPLLQSEANFTVTGNGTTLSSSTDSNCFTVGGGGNTWLFTFDQTKPACLAKLQPGKTYTFKVDNFTSSFKASHEYAATTSFDYYENGAATPDGFRNTGLFSYKSTDTSVYFGGGYWYKYLKMVDSDSDWSTPLYSLPYDHSIKPSDMIFTSSSNIGTPVFAQLSPDTQRSPGQFGYYFYYRQGQASNICVGNSPAYPYWYTSRDVTLMINCQSFILDTLGNTDVSVAEGLQDPRPYEYIVFIGYEYYDIWSWSVNGKNGQTNQDSYTGIYTTPSNTPINVPVSSGGQTVNLSWKAHGVQSPTTACTSTSSSGNSGWTAAAKVPEGSYSGSFSPGQSVSITCPRVNGNNSKLTFNFTAAPTPAPAVSLATFCGPTGCNHAATITAGDSAPLYWQTTNVYSPSQCRATPQITPTSTWWNNTLGGSTNVLPTTTTTYRLSCTTAGGTASDSVTINVTAPPTPTPSPSPKPSPSPAPSPSPSPGPSPSPLPPQNCTITFEGDGRQLNVSGSLVSDTICFNPRDKGGTEYAVSIFVNQALLNSPLPGFDSIFSVILGQ